MFSVYTGAITMLGEGTHVELIITKERRKHDQREYPLTYIVIIIIF
jgi:hypothetical protein